MSSELSKRVVWLRLAQLLINEDYRSGLFKVPIHLALGHEALAVALDSTMTNDDRLLLSHRNIAYNLAREKSLKKIRDEYLLKKSGLARGKLGSMNLSNPLRGIPYSSSILGNDFAVGAGVALALKQKGKGVTFALGGDGSMEEGTFYESLVFAKSQALPLIVIIENNEWSMSTKIDERRAPIDLELFARSIGVMFKSLQGNSAREYASELDRVRSLSRTGPVLVEAKIHTLGDWVKQEEKGPRLINYHAGPAPEIRFDGVRAVILESDDDPLFVVQEAEGAEWLLVEVQSALEALKKEL